MNPDEKARAYLDTHQIMPLFEKLCAELVLAKPENPRAFLAQLLANMQGQADLSVFNDADLDVMFGMFDRINTGTINTQQLHTALKAMGLKANRTIHPDTSFSKYDFKREVRAAVHS
jgi:hypothetical protein